MLLEASHLTKTIGRKTLLRDVSLTAGVGDIVGLLGTNGAGKSTTLKTIAGLLPPSEGTVSIEGTPLYGRNRKLLGRIGMASEIPNFPAEHSAKQLLTFCATIRRVKDVGNAVGVALEKTDLSGVSDQPVNTLSKGFQQRVSIAQAIVHNPDIVLLDEPSSGLDPSQTQQLLSLISGIGEQAVVVFSSHSLVEIESTATQAIIMSDGRIVHREELNEMQHQSMLLRVTADTSLPDLAPLSSELTAAKCGENCWEISHPTPVSIAPELVRYLTEKQCNVVELRHQGSSLESTYLDVIQRNFA